MTFPYLRSLPGVYRHELRACLLASISATCVRACTACVSPIFDLCFACTGVRCVTVPNLRLQSLLRVYRHSLRDCSLSSISAPCVSVCAECVSSNVNFCRVFNCVRFTYLQSLLRVYRHALRDCPRSPSPISASCIPACTASASPIPMFDICPFPRVHLLCF